MKILPVETDLFHVDGQTDGETDMTKLTAAFTILRTSQRLKFSSLNCRCAPNNFFKVVLLFSQTQSPKYAQRK
jgi:hypothetical protein